MKREKLVLFINRLLLVLVLIFGLVIHYFQPTIFDYFVYWWILILILIIGLIFNFKSLSYLTLAFVLFFLSGLSTVIGLLDVAEIFMRLSFIGWMIGLTKSLVEYRNSK